ncbi:MAG TPA: hypothetical protein VHC69_32955 [Polyangiaceae bacterium]|nr:hypothetical protein [Polyangiaceae bacterium]
MFAYFESIVLPHRAIVGGFAITLFTALLAVLAAVGYWGGADGLVKWISALPKPEHDPADLAREGSDLYAKYRQYETSTRKNGNGPPPPMPDAVLEAAKKWQGTLFKCVFAEQTKRKREDRVTACTYLILGSLLLCGMTIVDWTLFVPDKPALDDPRLHTFARFAFFSFVCTVTAICWAAPLAICMFRHGVPKKKE